MIVCFLIQEVKFLEKLIFKIQMLKKIWKLLKSTIFGTIFPNGVVFHANKKSLQIFHKSDYFYRKITLDNSENGKKENWGRKRQGFLPWIAPTQDRKRTQTHGNKLLTPFYLIKFFILFFVFLRRTRIDWTFQVLRRSISNRISRQPCETLFVRILRLEIAAKVRLHLPFFQV